MLKQFKKPPEHFLSCCLALLAFDTVEPAHVLRGEGRGQIWVKAPVDGVGRLVGVAAVTSGLFKTLIQ